MILIHNSKELRPDKYLRSIAAANSTLDVILNATITYFSILGFVLLNDFKKPLLPLFIASSVIFLLRICSSIESKFTLAITNLTSCMVSCKRVSSFLHEQEIQSRHTKSSDSSNDDTNVAVMLRKCSSQWKDEKGFKIDPIDVVVKKG